MKCADRANQSLLCVQLKQKFCVKISHRCGRNDSVVLTLYSASVMAPFAIRDSLDSSVPGSIWTVVELQLSEHLPVLGVLFNIAREAWRFVSLNRLIASFSMLEFPWLFSEFEDFTCLVLNAACTLFHCLLMLEWKLCGAAEVTLKDSGSAPHERHLLLKCKYFSVGFSGRELTHSLWSGVSWNACWKVHLLK